MKRYLLVYELNTSSYHIIQPICDLFHDQIDYCSSDEINEIDHNLYHRIIFCYRKELHMWRKLKDKPLDNEKYIFLTHGGVFPFKTASLGWTEYVTSEQKYYIPLASLIYWNKSPRYNQEEAIGFYIEKQIYDDYEKEKIRDIAKNVGFCKTYELGVHYTNKVDFFNAITSFYYYVPKALDAMPCVLLEAMLAGVKLYVNRTPRGGSSDLFSAYEGGNINVSTYVKIWQKLIDEEFEYEFDKRKYRTFNEWIEGEIL